jgi:hypothetical protein
VLRKLHYPNGKRYPIRTFTVLSVGHGAVRVSVDPPMSDRSNFNGLFHLGDWPYLMSTVNTEVLHVAD